MIIIMTKLKIHLLIIIICLLHSTVIAHRSHKHNTNLPCQDPASPSPLGYRCNVVLDHGQCSTFALLRANSYFSSLSKLTTSLGTDRFTLLQANAFSPNTDALPLGYPLLIPINCLCNKDSLFGAYLSKLAAKGDSFYSIYNSLQGLTTCNAIRDKNPNVIDIKEKLQLLIPLRCACPSSSTNGTTLLLTYPVNDGDTISKLAYQFNVTKESIVSANINSFSPELSNPDNILPVFHTLLIPLGQKPAFASLGYDPLQSSSRKKKKKHRRMGIGLYIGLTVSVSAAGIAVAAVYMAMKRKRERKNDQPPPPPPQRSSNKMADVEVQQLSLSIRTTASDKKISFDLRSQDTIDGHVIEAANPLKSSILEVYTVEELNKATEEFDSSNLIEGSVFQGRLNGKTLAIKKTNPETISKLEFGFFHDSTHHHPNIIRLIGTGNSTTDGPSDSFLVFEYAENGSLMDWLHGGLAMKSQFIASCYCFLNWNQRLKICLDVAIALQYMHKLKNPNYIHRNIKSRNIFLDDEFNAKVGNFGMAKCVEDEINSSLNRAYLAPEYLKHRILSPSTDIFAYGVVLMEVLSGRPPVTKKSDQEKGDGGTRMWEKIKGLLKRENAAELVREWMDNALGEEYPIETAVAVVNLAVACVEEEARARPSAVEIVEKLSRLTASPEGGGGGRQSDMCESSSKPLVKNE